MPNLVDIEIRREKGRVKFRDYWKKDTAYKAEKLQRNRDYVNASYARMRGIYVRRRIRLGLVPFFAVLKLTGLRVGFMRKMIKAGFLPKARKFRSWSCYTIEQAVCLTQATLHANISTGNFFCFSVDKFEEYIKANWPWEEKDYEHGFDGK
jgi:hypothetical protein